LGSVFFGSCHGPSAAQETSCREGHQPRLPHRVGATRRQTTCHGRTRADTCASRRHEKMFIGCGKMGRADAYWRLGYTQLAWVGKHADSGEGVSPPAAAGLGCSTHRNRRANKPERACAGASRLQTTAALPKNPRVEASNTMTVLQHCGPRRIQVGGVDGLKGVHSRAILPVGGWSTREGSGSART